MAAKTSQHMGYDDLMALPADDFLHELVRGEVLQMPPPKGMPGRIEMRLAGAIERYLYQRAVAEGWTEEQGSDERDLLVGALAGGEFGIRFTLPDDPDQVRGVDVCYLSPEQVAFYEASGSDDYFRAVPVLVAEVISPSEAAAYVNEKVQDYLTGGAHLVWLLFPRTRTVQVYRPNQPAAILTSAEPLDGGDVLPGFSVRVGSLFT